MSTFKKEDVVKSGFNAPLPKARYIMRGLKTEFGESRQGNPMTTFSAEFVCTPDGDEVIEVNGEKVNIAGRPLKIYISYTEAMMAQTFEFFDKMGNPIEEIDSENPPDTKFLHGILFEVIASAEPSIAFKPMKPGQKEPEPILGSDGKPIITGFQTNISAILGKIDKLPEKAVTPY